MTAGEASNQYDKQRDKGLHRGRLVVLSHELLPAYTVSHIKRRWESPSCSLDSLTIKPIREAFKIELIQNYVPCS